MAHSNVARCLFRNYMEAANLMNLRAACRITISAGTISRFYKLPNVLLCSKPSLIQKHAGCRWFADDASKNVDLAFNDLQALIKSGDIQLVDVREPNELEEYGRFPQSMNIPLKELHGALNLSQEEFRKKYGINKPRNEDKNIVFCCLKGIRSLKAIGIASDLGYLKTRHYKGGWEEYHKEMGLPLKKNPSGNS